MRPGRAVIALILAGVACGLAPRLVAQAPLRMRTYAPGFTTPLAIVQDPGDRAVQFVVEQGGRIRVVRDGVVSDTDFLDLRGAIISGGEQGLLGLAFPPDPRVRGFSSTSPIVRATPSWRASGDRRRTGWSGIRRRASTCDGARGSPSSASRSRTTTAAISPSVRTVFSTSAWATAGRETTPTTARRIPTSCSARCCASTSASPTRIPPASACRPTIRSSTRRARGTRSGTSACAIPGASPSTTRRAAAPARWSSATSGRIRSEEIDYEPRGRGGRNYGWRNREGAHDYITSRPPAFTPLVDPIFEYDHTVGASITGGYVYRGTRLGADYQGRYFFADFIRGRVWSIALTVEQATGEARASGLREHTSELGGTDQLGNVSSFGTDQDGEVFVISYSRGIVFKLAGPLTAPPAPVNPRIVR